MTKGAAAISILLAAVLGFVVGTITTQASNRGPSVTAEAGGSNGPRQADSDRIPVGNSPSIGPANALVTIVEFSDFECPFCSRVEDTIRQVRQRYGNDVRVVWKNNPLPFHQNAPRRPKRRWPPTPRASSGRCTRSCSRTSGPSPAPTSTATRRRSAWT
jgi:protein-disulfide isomerase